MSAERIELGLGPEDIQKLIPHRAPLLLVDTLVAGSREGPVLWASKQISADEPVFAGHFPDQPVWPGAYTIEGLAQCCALALAWVEKGSSDSTPARPVLASVQVKLTRPVAAGDRIDYRVEATHRTGGLVRFQVEATVASREVAVGNLTVGTAR